MNKVVIIYVIVNTVVIVEVQFATDLVHRNPTSIAIEAKNESWLLVGLCVLKVTAYYVTANIKFEVLISNAASLRAGLNSA